MDSNKTLIKDYFDFKKTVKNLTNNTISEQFNNLESYDKFINKPFTEVTEKEILEYLSRYKPTTRNPRLSILRGFYKWLLKLDENQPLPEYLRRLKFVRLKQDDIKYRERVVTEQEYNILIANCSTPMHRAIIETLYNFGVRRSELVSMKASDVIYCEGITKITVRESKTRTRDSIYDGRSKYLLEWVEVYHPYKEQSDKPLFPGSKDKSFNKVSVNHLIKRTCQKARLKRKITPHDFRHTAITNSRAKGVPDTHIETNYGLVHGTSQLQIYDHNKTKNYEEYLRARNSEIPITHEKQKEIIETLEQKHEKEIKNIKEELEAFKLFFDVKIKKGEINIKSKDKIDGVEWTAKELS